TRSKRDWSSDVCSSDLATATDSHFRESIRQTNYACATESRRFQLGRQPQIHRRIQGNPHAFISHQKGAISLRLRGTKTALHPSTCPENSPAKRYRRANDQPLGPQGSPQTASPDQFSQESSA